MIQRKFSILLLSALSLLLGVSGNAVAQKATVGVSPAFIDAKVKRGTTYSKVFNITNTTPARLRFRCSTADYWYDENNKRIEGRAGTLPRSASLWVQFSPAEIIVEPNSTAAVKALITVPQTASGGYYTMPIFQGEQADLPVAQKVSNGATARASLAFTIRGLLMFATDDNSEYNVEVAGGKVTPPSISSPFELNLDINNRSTAHASLRGAFAIFDQTGKVAGRAKIEGKRFLPGQRGLLKAPWTGELAPGKYTALVTLSYDRAGAEPASLVYELQFEVKAQAGEARP